jgi:hypothetical protein
MVVISDELLSMIQPGLKLTKTKDKAPTLRFLLPTINSTDRPLLTVSIGDITRFTACSNKMNTFPPPKALKNIF